MNSISYLFNKIYYEVVDRQVRHTPHPTLGNIFPTLSRPPLEQDETETGKSREKATMDSAQATIENTAKDSAAAVITDAVEDNVGPTGRIEGTPTKVSKEVAVEMIKDIEHKFLHVAGLKILIDTIANVVYSITGFDEKQTKQIAKDAGIKGVSEGQLSTLDRAKVFGTKMGVKTSQVAVAGILLEPSQEEIRSIVGPDVSDTAVNGAAGAISAGVGTFTTTPIRLVSTASEMSARSITDCAKVIIENAQNNPSKTAKIVFFNPGVALQVARDSIFGGFVVGGITQLYPPIRHALEGNKLMTKGQKEVVAATGAALVSGVASSVIMTPIHVMSKAYSSKSAAEVAIPQDVLEENHKKAAAALAEGKQAVVKTAKKPVIQQITKGIIPGFIRNIPQIVAYAILVPVVYGFEQMEASHIPTSSHTSTSTKTKSEGNYISTEYGEIDMDQQSVSNDDHGDSSRFDNVVSTEYGEINTDSFTVSDDTHGDSTAFSSVISTEYGEIDIDSQASDESPQEDSSPSDTTVVEEDRPLDITDIF